MQNTLWILRICLVVLLPATTLAQTASFFEGVWKCEVKSTDEEKHLKFQWEAHVVMDGQWISGKTTVQNSIQSMDLWKVEKTGQPSKRTVFLVDGSTVEIDGKGWWKDRMKVKGHVYEGKKSIPIRETIRKISEKEFEAHWEKKVGKKWIEQPKEHCEKIK